MISLVICSAHKKISEALVNNITESIGVQHEIVYIDNHDNRHSIFSAYNEGVARCKYPYICFIHEDVFFHSHNWGGKLINHLQTPNVGICGLAGRDFTIKDVKDVFAELEDMIENGKTVEQYQYIRLRG
jgi:hypothetical protein